MAWETRNGRGKYYTRSVWQDGRVVREYIGAGQKGMDVARHDVQKRVQIGHLRQLAKEGEQEEKGRISSLEVPLVELDKLCRILMDTAMDRAGFHRPKRWVWRKKRRLIRCRSCR